MTITYKQWFCNEKSKWKKIVNLSECFCCQNIVKRLALVFFLSWNLWLPQYFCTLSWCLESVLLCNLKTTLTVDHFYSTNNLFISLGECSRIRVFFSLLPWTLFNTTSCSTIFGLIEIAAISFWRRNTSMAFQMIFLHILILQILVICLFIELVVGHRLHAQPCQLEQNLLQIQQELYL